MVLRCSSAYDMNFLSIWMCLFARADVSAKWAMIWVIINVNVACSGQVSECHRVWQITLRKCVFNGPDAAFASKAMLQ